MPWAVPQKESVHVSFLYLHRLCLFHQEFSKGTRIAKTILKKEEVGECLLGCHPTKAEGCLFDSQSGHMPGLWIRSLVGARRRGNQPIHVSLSH